jgi:hypothetical protein
VGLQDDLEGCGILYRGCREKARQEGVAKEWGNREVAGRRRRAGVAPTLLLVPPSRHEWLGER